MNPNAEYIQVSDDDLKAMLIFLNITVLTRETLKTTVRNLLKVNHVDKGGDLVINQQITRANRILTACLDNNRVIPGCTAPPPEKPPPEPARGTFTDYYNYANNATDDWSMYGKMFRSKKTRNMKFKTSTKFERAFYADSEDDGDTIFDKEAARARSRPKTYNNEYIYDSGDEYWPNDKQDYSKAETGGEEPRCVRGGLALRKSLTSIGLPETYTNLVESDINVCELKQDELETNKKLSDLLPLLTNFSTKPSFDTLIDRTQAFVYLEWAKTEQSNCTPYTNVSLRARSNGIVQVYLPQIEEDDIVDDRLKEGAIIQIFSLEDSSLSAKATVKLVDLECQTIEIKFINEMVGKRLVDSKMLMNISMVPGAFIYKAFTRGIKEVLHRKMNDFVFPNPTFAMSQEKYEKFSDERIARDAEQKAAEDNAPSSSNDTVPSPQIEFNTLQLRAIDTVVNGVNRPYPFVLFGPPGTGKTATLVEAVRRIMKQGKEKRVLICATSNMAADVIALTILKRNFIDPKYVFRLNSLSGDVKVRNLKLDPIVCITRGADSGYGIPVIRNLQVFRIIVTTLTGSVYLNMAGGLRGYFSHIFIDEAGQATEQETWIPIGGLAVPGETMIALFGDHKQLGAVDQVPVLKNYGYAVSMLERLITQTAYAANDRRLTVMLEKNYRSHELILRPASTLFYDKKLTSNKEDPKLYGMCGWSKLLNPSFPLIFNSIRCSREQRSYTHSFTNMHELNECLNYVNDLTAYNVSPSDIGIISPYRCQATELKNLLNKYDKRYHAIAVNSVEGFQGSERRVIILLTTRSNSLGFLYCDKRLNTSITRARELLIVLGDETLLSQHLNWKKLINYIKNHDGFIPSSLVRHEYNEFNESKKKQGVKFEQAAICGGVEHDADKKTTANLSDYKVPEDDADFHEPVRPLLSSNMEWSDRAGGNRSLTEIVAEQFEQSSCASETHRSYNEERESENVDRIEPCLSPRKTTQPQASREQWDEYTNQRSNNNRVFEDHWINPQEFAQNCRVYDHREHSYRPEQETYYEEHRSHHYDEGGFGRYDARDKDDYYRQNEHEYRDYSTREAQYYDYDRRDRQQCEYRRDPRYDDRGYSIQNQRRHDDMYGRRDDSRQNRDDRSQYAYYDHREYDRNQDYGRSYHNDDYYDNEHYDRDNKWDRQSQQNDRYKQPAEYRHNDQDWSERHVVNNDRSYSNYRQEQKYEDDWDCPTSSKESNLKHVSVRVDDRNEFYHNGTVQRNDDYQPRPNVQHAEKREIFVMDENDDNVYEQHQPISSRHEAYGNYCFDSSFDEECEQNEKGNETDFFAVIDNASSPKRNVLVSPNYQSLSTSVTNNDLENVNRFCNSKVSEGDWMF